MFSYFYTFSTSLISVPDIWTSLWHWSQTSVAGLFICCYTTRVHKFIVSSLRAQLTWFNLKWSLSAFKGLYKRWDFIGSIHKIQGVTERMKLVGIICSDSVTGDYSLQCQLKEMCPSPPGDFRYSKNLRCQNQEWSLSRYIYVEFMSKIRVLLCFKY